MKIHFKNIFTAFKNERSIGIGLSSYSKPETRRILQYRIFYFTILEWTFTSEISTIGL